MSRRRQLDKFSKAILAFLTRIFGSGTRDTKINKNAPCPCGSGRKYKRCCMANAQGAR